MGVTPDNILGLLSLVFWSLTLVISMKYLRFVMRADNDGEGGVMALLALVISPVHVQKKRRVMGLAFLGLFGAALLYGDGMITPAISVLSAVEGLEVATTTFSPFVVPITCGILDRSVPRSEARDGRDRDGFWPPDIGLVRVNRRRGRPWILRRPEILYAVNPVHAVRFFARHGLHGFLVLGSVVLCITGGEALYADMGHFGRRAIKVAWYAVVFPALLINYFGQGALLLARPETTNPFYALVPGRLAVSDGGHRDDRDGGGVAGLDLGGVFSDPAGGSAWLCAADDHRSHVGKNRRPDLYPRGE